MSVAFPVIVIGIVCFYYFVDPNTVHFPIQCPWRMLTHTSCPACGMQRALFALVHGQFAQALSYNYFFIISIPMALCAVLAQWYNYGGRFNRLRRVVFHRYTLYVYIVLFCLWWVVRNLLGI
ncbi:MAG: DUF2752 domain-containing protein [Muribaculaceae bacterium]